MPNEINVDTVHGVRFTTVCKVTLFSDTYGTFTKAFSVLVSLLESVSQLITYDIKIMRLHNYGNIMERRTYHKGILVALIVCQ